MVIPKLDGKEVGNCVDGLYEGKTGDPVGKFVASGRDGLRDGARVVTTIEGYSVRKGVLVPVEAGKLNWSTGDVGDSDDLNVGEKEDGNTEGDSGAIVGMTEGGTDLNFDTCDKETVSI